MTTAEPTKPEPQVQQVESSLLREGVIPGAIGGFIGGIVFGLVVLELGGLPAIAGLVRLDSSVAGFLVNMPIATFIGVGLGVLVWHQRPGIGETLLWGTVYGTFWWFIGPLTLNPLIRLENFSWNLVDAQASFSVLIAHVLFGAVAGLTVVLFQQGRQRGLRLRGVSVWTLIGGALAGLVAAAKLGSVLSAQGYLHTFAGVSANEPRLTIWLIVLAIGLTVGIGFSMLYPRSRDSMGAGVIRGVAFAFLAWVVLPLSLVPVLTDSDLSWGLSNVREAFPSLPAYLLFGAVLSLWYQWISGLFRLLFGEFERSDHSEAVGTQGLRSVGHGILAGIVGGLIFAGVMIQIGALTNVAGLIGVTSPVTGFFVHMVIAIMIGTTFGLMFRRQSYDLASALGWGASYGFVWWMIGPLTLFPTFIGTTPLWTADVVANTFPNLIGHLLFGGGLGVTLHVLEARYSPWWIARRQAQADVVARRREQVLTSAPAVWTFIVILSLTIPVLLGTTDGTVGPSGY